MNVNDFFQNDYVNYASYDNYRSISSNIDGLKVSARKIIWTILKNNIKNEIKVSQLCSKVAEQTEYLHGETSLVGVTIGLAQDFIGSNNLPLLKREGNFGNRLINEASAARYIKTSMEDYLIKIFRPEDNNVLIKQEFEGSIIEPKYLLPIIPLHIINGTEGISSGFAQKILPRDLKEIKKYIICALEAKATRMNLKPYYNGFNGKVFKDENGTWCFEGNYEIVNTNTIKITELPPQYNLKKYKSVLDKLEDSNKIVSYEDLSDNDKFQFIIKFKRMDLTKHLKNEIVFKDSFLKLIKKESENFTVLDENNKISEYNNLYEMLNHYISDRIKWYEIRKENLLQKMLEEMKFAYSKYKFIECIINGNLKVQNTPENKIIKFLDSQEKIIRKNETYNYLLNIPVRNLTREQFLKLKEDIKNMKQRYEELKNKEPKDIWIEELKEI